MASVCRQAPLVSEHLFSSEVISIYAQSPQRNPPDSFCWTRFAEAIVYMYAIQSSKRYMDVDGRIMQLTEQARALELPIESGTSTAIELSSLHRPSCKQCAKVLNAIS